MDGWLPRELEAGDRTALITGNVNDILAEVDYAIGLPPQRRRRAAREAGTATTPGDDFDEETDFVDPSADKLLDRLLYWGVLPRYAFPTDVAPFYVFNPALSTGFRPKMEFAPSQGLNIALSQYAPKNKSGSGVSNTLRKPSIRLSVTSGAMRGDGGDSTSNAAAAVTRRPTLMTKANATR